jgi:hypothetical protein
MKLETSRFAAKLLMNASPDSIVCLEQILIAEGFVQELTPAKLNFSQWYWRNLGRDTSDRTDYLSSYKDGFIRRHNHSCWSFLAGYGIFDTIDILEDKIILDQPHHFFFIELVPHGMNGLDLVKYLADKAKYSPGNPANSKLTMGFSWLRQNASSLYGQMEKYFLIYPGSKPKSAFGKPEYGPRAPISYRAECVNRAMQSGLE